MCSTIHKTYTFSHNNLLSFGNNNITLSSFSKAEINNDPEKYFTEDIMVQLELAAKKEFMYGSTEDGPDIVEYDLSESEDD